MEMEADLLWRDPFSGQVGIWLMDGSAPKSAVAIGSPSLSWVIIINTTGISMATENSDILWQFADTSRYSVWFIERHPTCGNRRFYASFVRRQDLLRGRLGRVTGLPILVTFLMAGTLLLEERGVLAVCSADLVCSCQPLR